MRRGIAVFAVIVSGLGAGQLARRRRREVRQAAPDADVLPALLTEVRGLRTAIEQMASAAPRVQLALGRLQLQEQRVENVVRRLDAVREKLVGRQTNYDRLQQTLTSMDDAAGQPRQASHPTAAELSDMLSQFRREAAQAAADVQRLTAEESAVAAELATEQGRWSDLNQQMEALERTLTRRERLSAASNRRAQLTRGPVICSSALTPLRIESHHVATLTNAADPNRRRFSACCAGATSTRRNS